MTERATGILYIDPVQTDDLVVDRYTRKMAYLLNQAQGYPDSTGSYFAESKLFAPRICSKGVRTCHCGASSTDQDYLISAAIATNWLAVHYLAYHRSAVPQEVFDVLDYLDGDLMEPTPELLQTPADR